MELLVQVRKVCPAQTRDYTRHDGTPAQFHTRGMVLGNGVDEIYVEVTGEQALPEPTLLETQDWRIASLKAQTRQFTGQDGQIRFITTLELKGLSGTTYR